MSLDRKDETSLPRDYLNALFAESKLDQVGWRLDPTQENKLVSTVNTDQQDSVEKTLKSLDIPYKLGKKQDGKLEVEVTGTDMEKKFTEDKIKVMWTCFLPEYLKTIPEDFEKIYKDAQEKDAKTYKDTEKQTFCFLFHLGTSNQLPSVTLALKKNIAENYDGRLVIKDMDEDDDRLFQNLPPDNITTSRERYRIGNNSSIYQDFFTCVPTTFNVKSVKALADIVLHPPYVDIRKLETEEPEKQDFLTFFSSAGVTQTVSSYLKDKDENFFDYKHQVQKHPQPLKGKPGDYLLELDELVKIRIEENYIIEPLRNPIAEAKNDENPKAAI